MEALKTQNGNFLVKTQNDCAYFTPQGIFIKKAPLSEWEWANSTWGVEVIQMNFMFPEEDDRVDYSLNEIVISYVKQSGVYLCYSEEWALNHLTFQEPENFQVVHGFEMLDFSKIATTPLSHLIEDGYGNNVSKIALGLINLNEHTLLYSYCEDLEDDTVIGSFTLIKGSFQDQLRETVELTESFKALQFKKILETIN